MKDAYYFSHDSNARNDLKIKGMIYDYGMRGYGWYWVLLEMMRDEEGYKLPYNGKHTHKILAEQLRTTVSCAKKFIEDCINTYKLFKSDSNYFWSASLLKRMAKREEVILTKRYAGKKSGQARATDAQHPRTDAEQGKEGKERKESKKEYQPYVLLFLREYDTLVRDYGIVLTKRAIDKLSNYKGALPKKRRYESDYHAILSWVMADVGGKDRDQLKADQNLKNEQARKKREVRAEQKRQPLPKDLTTMIDGIAKKKDITNATGGSNEAQ